MKNLVLVAGLISLPAFAVDAAAFDLKGDAAKGEAHYKTLCISCHGEKGDGNGPAGASMNPKPGNFTDPANADRITGEWAYKMVKNGGPANGKSPMMIAWSGVLNDQQVRDVSAYVLKFKFVKAEPAKAAPAKTPAAPKKK